jgi:hypothetical protein
LQSDEGNAIVGMMKKLNQLQRETTMMKKMLIGKLAPM